MCRAENELRSCYKKNALRFIRPPRAAFANPAYAVCTAAIGASSGVACKLGVNDDIVALWAEAFI